LGQINTMNNTQTVVQKLAVDLRNVDKSHVCDLVTKFGLYGAARILGYDISHYNNLLMSGRLAIEHLRNTAPKTLLEYAEVMKERLNKATYQFIQEHHKELQSAIDANSQLDYDHDWFSANTMITMYSATPSYGRENVETPQYTWMRIAIQMFHDHKQAVKRVIGAYNEMAHGWYTPASPTIFNAGMKNPQCSSCFLLSIGDDTKKILKNGIYYGGMISGSSGGLGFDISQVRHSEIGNYGMSDGIVPMIHMYEAMVRYMNQRGKRKGAATLFLRPHHIDVEDFIDLTRKVGDKYARAHDINTCLWTSWIFWERVRAGGKWTLFCPARTKHLNDLYGEAFTKAYVAAENDSTILPHHKKVINARDLYDKILSVQRGSGMPYLMNGDAANIKSNHRHNGYIKSSNLCLEVIEYTDDETIAVCNLHSLSLRTFAKHVVDLNDKDVHAALRQAVDFQQLAYISRRVIENLNAVIDHNWYPLDKHDAEGNVTKPKIINKSNKRHRPVGMGVSGWAEMLHILDLPFEHPLTSELNKMVFACMYWNALAQSVAMAMKYGAYDTFPGSPTSEGKLQFDLWKEEFQILGPNAARKAEDDEPIDPTLWGQEAILAVSDDGAVETIQPTWADLKRCIMKHGLYNSLLLANMPTASTAQVRRNCESVEAHQNNLYSRKVLKCSYPVLNRYMLADLEELGVWNPKTVDYIRVKNGSIQGFGKYVTDNPVLFPDFNGNVARMEHIEKKYKTMWEISQKHLMKLAADRGRYVDQSSSTNVFMKDCTDEKLKACHIYANMLGLKTIMYYLRSKGGETIKFTADPNMIQHIRGIAVEREDEKGEDNVVETTSPTVAPKINKQTGFVCTDDICVSCT
jgi:ribonucleoside-diphosphate reductase alpha subunit